MVVEKRHCHKSRKLKAYALNHTQNKEDELGIAYIFKLSKPVFHYIVPKTRSYLLKLRKSTIYWGLSIQVPETIMDVPHFIIVVMLFSTWASAFYVMNPQQIFFCEQNP